MLRRVLYFAYGSNMYEPRMRERIGSAKFQDTVVLDDYRLHFNKLGQDSSAKCNIVETPGQSVFGVLYALSGHQLELLDQVEGPDYQRQLVTVCSLNHGRVHRAEAFTALSHAITDALKPASWYCDMVIAGAEMHDLPSDYVAALRKVSSTASQQKIPETENS
ncbi:MAG: gamma-glutamylcyclotransferase family protein [Gammaproteobacteria bacterium]